MTNQKVDNRTIAINGQNIEEVSGAGGDSRKAKPRKRNSE